MGALDLWRSMTRTDTTPRPDSITGLWWQEPRGSLSQIVIDDVFGEMVELVDRPNAMRVAPIVKARSLLVGSIADLPFVIYRGDDPLADQPSWAVRSKYQSIWHRWADTIDDLLFYDASLWWRENGEDGRLLDAFHIPYEAWEVDAQRRILVNDADGNPQPVADDQVIYFRGPGSPLIEYAKDTIKGARGIDKAWVARTRSPVPPTLFEQTENETATEVEVKGLVTGWAGARTNPETAAVGYVPYGLKAVFPPTTDDSAMFIEGRNGVRLDIANFTAIPASLLDGSTATASLTYVTAEGQRSSFHEQTMRYWTAPIEHRLSMDDICPRGQRGRFDITYTTQVPPTGEPGED